MAILSKEREALRSLAEQTGIAEEKLVGIVEKLAAQTGATVEVVVGAIQQIVPTVLATLANVNDLTADLDARVEAITPEQVAKLPQAALVVLERADKVLLRGGNTLRGLFPLTVKLQATPDSVLGGLLRDAQGKPGALTVTITPAHVPG